MGGIGDREVKTFELKGGGVVRIGRSPVADFHIDHRGISQYHAEIRQLQNGAGPPRLCVRDLSSNGTGVKRPGADGDSPVCIKKDVDEPLVDGMQLLIPMRLKENHSGRAWLTVNLKGATDDEPEEEKGRRSASDASRKASPGKSPAAPAKAESDSGSASEKEEDQESARKKFVELLLKTREISGSSTYQQAEKLLMHEAAWKACDDSTRKECFHIFVDHLGDKSSKKKDKKKGKDKDVYLWC